MTGASTRSWRTGPANEAGAGGWDVEHGQGLCGLWALRYVNFWQDQPLWKTALRVESGILTFGFRSRRLADIRDRHPRPLGWLP